MYDADLWVCGGGVGWGQVCRYLMWARGQGSTGNLQPMPHELQAQWCGVDLQPPYIKTTFSLNNDNTQGAARAVGCSGSPFRHLVAILLHSVNHRAKQQEKQVYYCIAATPWRIQTPMVPQQHQRPGV